VLLFLFQVRRVAQNGNNIFMKDVDSTFYLENLLAYTNVESAIVRFSGYMAGALSADQAMNNPNGTVNNKVQGVRSAFKWEVDDNEPYTSLADLLNSTNNFEGLATSVLLQNIIQDSAKLLKLLKYSSRGGEHWGDYTFAEELVMVSRQLADSLKALRLNAISALLSGGQLEIF
jgi:hypothetical protein